LINKVFLQTFGDRLMLYGLVVGLLCSLHFLAAEAAQGDTAPDSLAPIIVELEPQWHSKSSPRLMVENAAASVQGGNIKFDKRGWISTELHQEAVGQPQGVEVLYRGIYPVSAPEAFMSWSANLSNGLARTGPRKDEVFERYPDYRWDIDVDGYVGFAVGKRGDSYVVCFDGNNNEDLSDDEALDVQVAYFDLSDIEAVKKTGKPSVKIGSSAPEGAYVMTYFAEAEVQYEFLLDEEVHTAQVKVGLYYHPKESEGEAPFSDVYQIRGEVQQWRRGKVRLGEKEYEVALMPHRMRYGTYYRQDCAVFFDVDGDGIFADEAPFGERYKGDEPFHIAGYDLEIGELSTDGKRMVLQSPIEAVAELIMMGEGVPAPDFTATTLDGQQIQLSALKGKVVVLNFWAIWCGPCVVKILGLNELVETFKGQDVVFIAPTTDNNTVDTFYQSSAMINLVT
jgi:hypothetical protein